MPEFAVTLRYRVEYVGTVSIRAASEEKAEERAQKAVAGIATLAAFEKYIDGDIDEDVNEVEVDEVQAA